jgi:TrmH family RNA methyltransferase
MKILTLIRDLRRRKARERHGLFVVEGVRGVEELLRSNLAIKGALTSPRIRETDRGAALEQALADRGVRIEQVDDKEFASAAETDAPQGVLAVAEVPHRRLADLPLADRMRLLILDAVQDPGNVGTMIRTAAALGATATVALPGTVDLWNAKVVRSGMGSHFHTPVLTGTWDELAEFRDRHGLELWAADASGEAVAAMLPPPRLGLIVGNEGSGLSSQTRERASRLVALPIAPAVESLNVAVAAGILLYELDR